MISTSPRCPAKDMGNAQPMGRGLAQPTPALGGLAAKPIGEVQAGVGRNTHSNHLSNGVVGDR